MKTFDLTREGNLVRRQLIDHLKACAKTLHDIGDGYNGNVLDEMAEEYERSILPGEEFYLTWVSEEIA